MHGNASPKSFEIFLEMPEIGCNKGSKISVKCVFKKTYYFRRTTYYNLQSELPIKNNLRGYVMLVFMKEKHNINYHLIYFKPVCFVTVPRTHFGSPQKFWTGTCSLIVNSSSLLPLSILDFSYVSLCISFQHVLHRGQNDFKIALNIEMKDSEIAHA